jgi:hypothetical protein
MTWSLGRNSDYSHMIAIMFISPTDVLGGGIPDDCGIAKVPGILMKESDQARGTPAQFEDLREELGITTRGGRVADIGYGPFDVQVNPSESDLRAMAHEGPIRIPVDDDKNLYAWDADRAIHSAVAHTLDLNEKHEDTWLMLDGKLVSEQYLHTPDPQQVGGPVSDKIIREAVGEVREVLDSLKTGEHRMAKQIIKLMWLA